MAEYYPLLARAVSGLKTSTPQARRAIYERARGALLAQLRAMNPPVPEADIARESDALDAAIARLESECGAPDDAAREVATEKAAQEQAALQKAANEKAAREREAQAAQERASQERAAQERAAQERAVQEKAAQEKAAQERAAQERAALEKAAQEKAAQKKAAEEKAAEARRIEEEARLAADKREREARERSEAAEAQARMRAEMEIRLRAEAQAARVDEPQPGPVRPPAPGRVASPDRPTLAQSSGESVAPPASPDDTLFPQLRDALLTLGEPSASATASAPPLEAPPLEARRDAPDLDAAPELAPDLESEMRARPARPAAPAPAPERRSPLRYILAGGALALVMGAIAYAAWLLRDNPQALPQPKTAVETPAPAESGGKISDRVDIGSAQPVQPVPVQTTPIRPQPNVPAPAPQPAAPPATEQAGAQTGAQEILAPARAAFLIQSDGPDQHKTYSGTVTWSATGGVWRAAVEIPEIKLSLSFAMSKAPAGGPASHNIELRFKFDDPQYTLARVGAPEMRKEENPYGDRLAAVTVPVTQDVYLVGLRKDEADIAYNLELIRSRGWIDIPMEMSDKRIAKITFEKGPAGERTFEDAAKGW